MLFGQEHVERYRATDGAEGHVWQEGSHVLLLTTTGRRSGERRTTPLIGRSGDDVLIVASNGGFDPPAWYLNIQEDPNVGVQILADRFDAVARVATAEEKPEMWAEMVSHWKHYDEYQERADREIPVVVLERV